MSEHGTLSRYTNGGCRCDKCRQAKREYARDYRRRNFRQQQRWSTSERARLRERIEAGDPTVRHGSVWSYNCGCRCQPCTQVASARRMKARAVKRAES